MDTASTEMNTEATGAQIAPHQNERRNPVAVPIHDILTNRWSPRAFDASAPVSEGELAAVLEAARWAPSAHNSQPWRFLVGKKGGQTYERIYANLNEFNQMWATAPVLIVGIAESDKDGAVNSHAVYDLGQSIAHLSIQAHGLGLFVHQIAGFDAEGIARDFDLSATQRAVVVLTLEHRDDESVLHERMRHTERAPRERKELDELVLAAD